MAALFRNFLYLKAEWFLLPAILLGRKVFAILSFEIFVVKYRVSKKADPFRTQINRIAHVVWQKLPKHK